MASNGEEETGMSNELDQESLMSLERMDRSSPDLWPATMPGIYDVASLVSSPHTRPSTPGLTLTAQDQALLYQFSSLSPAELIEEVRKLQNVAYQLGVEEAKQMTRGKYLHVLAAPKPGADDG
ncbi:protein lin-52 homolog [Hyalella azteca]|uniref:Protein lin-52 homolog n=1 Tax=Hyalella azteca TaxID=294128 RepID=A0A8B7NVZ5_HYAAZ|nr:protein lin-52 homolog [Hyalella azteca]